VVAQVRREEEEGRPQVERMLQDLGEIVVIVVAVVVGVCEVGGCVSGVDVTTGAGAAAASSSAVPPRIRRRLMRRHTSSSCRSAAHLIDVIFPLDGG